MRPWSPTRRKLVRPQNLFLCGQKCVLTHTKIGEAENILPNQQQINAGDNSVTVCVPTKCNLEFLSGRKNSIEGEAIHISKFDDLRGDAKFCSSLLHGLR